MKIRNGFVSNSSSSSFLILKRDITAVQAYQILDHAKECEKYAMSCYEDEAWNINDHGKAITGSIFMDNFDMVEFLDRIGVDRNVIRWDEC